MNEGKSDVAVVVASCDEYSDIWPGFFKVWFRFWPDMPYPLYLISNRRTFPDKRVIPLPVGNGLNWSQRIARAFERVPQRHILLSTEDFFLMEPVDTPHVLRLHDGMVAEQAVYLRMMANPPADLPHASEPDIGYVEKGAPYRNSLQLAFWDRAMMLGLLRPEESPWDFEMIGARRTDEIAAPFLSVQNGVSPITYHNMLRRGKWNRDAIRDFAQLGISFDLGTRPVQNSFDVWWHTPSPSRRALSTCKRVVMSVLGRQSLSTSKPKVTPIA